MKRVHIQTRQELCVPQQTDDGPDVTKLISMRFSSSASYTPWTNNKGSSQSTMIGAKMAIDPWKQWTGSTNFEEQPAYKYEPESDDEDDTVQAANKAKGVRAPKQPTEQKRKEPELTHLPYRNWCAICVKSKGRADNHPRQHSKQAVIHMVFCYIKAFNDEQVLPVLTAIDVETNMTLEVFVQVKHKQFNYLSHAYKPSSLNVEEHKPH